MEKKSGKVPATAAAEVRDEYGLDEIAVWSISNWAFAWLFDFAEFGAPDDESDKSPVVSW